MTPDPIEYRSPDTLTPRSSVRRPMSRWLLLLAIWLVGVIVWVFYLALAAVVVIKVF